MSLTNMKVPDLGEGVVEVEIVEWYVKPGDLVSEDQHIVDLMTEKATVEVTSSISGRVASVAGEIGDMLAVGVLLIEFEAEANDISESNPLPQEEKQASGVTARVAPGSGALAEPAVLDSRPVPVTRNLSSVPSERPLASPAVRRRAREARIELARVPGTGRGGRVTHQDLDDFVVTDAVERPGNSISTGGRSRKLVGLRRRIATRMALSKRSIPHFSYVEEIDMTDLEVLRQHLNQRRDEQTAKLTYLPFILLALTRALAHFPQCNAHYDEVENTLTEFDAVHAGIATQTDAGLMVPVLKNVQGKNLHQLADEIRRLSDGARSNQLTAEDMSGSTVTVSSLGHLGGIVSTPVINPPEVAIFGINKVVERPVVRDHQVSVRFMMNLSSSFDHRVVDGYDAALMIQVIREMLEMPAMLFIEEIEEGPVI